MMTPAIRVAHAIKRVETAGVEECSEIRGASGEVGCLQFLPSTWDMWATEVLGYVPPKTPTNELYVASRMIVKWMQAGHSERDIALIWNAGCVCDRSGINKHGVAYDSGAYARKVLAYLQ